jgi:plastocyanin
LQVAHESRRGAIPRGEAMRGTALSGVVTLLVVAAPAGADTVQVGVSNFAFAPAEVKVQQGDVVTWTWNGPDTNHSTTTHEQGQTTWDSDAKNSSPDHQVGDKFSKEFVILGEFDYFCKVHPTIMTGHVSVGERVQDPTVPVSPDTVAPSFGTLRISLKARRVTFNLDEAAVVEGKLRGPKGYRRTLRLAGRVGTNRLRLPTRLRPGRYSMKMIATDKVGNESLPASVKFRLAG